MTPPKKLWSLYYTCMVTKRKLSHYTPTNPSLYLFTYMNTVHKNYTHQPMQRNRLHNLRDSKLYSRTSKWRGYSFESAVWIYFAVFLQQQKVGRFFSPMLGSFLYGHMCRWIVSTCKTRQEFSLQISFFYTKRSLLFSPVWLHFEILLVRSSIRIKLIHSLA